MRSLFWPSLLLLAACGGPEANTKSADPYERFLGEKELLGRSDVEATTELVALLEDPHFLVVVGALEVLSSRGRPELLQHVLPKLKHKHPMVRQAACEALVAIRNEEGIPGLIQALQDPEPPVRRSAVKALGAFSKKPEALRAIVEAVGDKDPSVSYMAHRMLREATKREDVPQSKDAWSQALK
jgi:HEAT repeat protein